MALGDLASRIKERANLVLLAGSALTVLSLLVPWWSLHSSVVNGQESLFDFSIGPLGMAIHTPIGDPSTLLAGFQVVYWIATIALLPVSVSLGFAVFHGVYCAVRARRGLRALIAPLWAVIGLVWWAFYFLLVSSFFSTLGLDIAPTGAADVTWQGYQLVGATWGWDLGLWLGIAGTAVLFGGAALTFRGAEAKARIPAGAKFAFGVHSIGLFLLALLNVGAMALVLVSLQSNGIAWLLLVPVVLLFAMASFARVPKPTTSGGKILGWAPKIPKVNLEIPKMPALGALRKEGSPPSRLSPSPPLDSADVACGRCGARFPTTAQRDAHRLTHAVGQATADVRKKADEIGTRLFRGP